MSSKSLAPSAATQFRLSTREFAQLHQVKPATVITQMGRKDANGVVAGHYLGIRPLKLGNGRYAWPDVQVAAEGGSL